MLVSLFSETLSTWNRSTVGNSVHGCHVPDVVDVLGEVLWNQYIVLQRGINEGAS